MTTAPPRPATRAAAPRRRVLAQAGFETATLLRNGEQLLVSLVLGRGALVGLALATTPSLGAGRLKCEQLRRPDRRRSAPSPATTRFCPRRARPSSRRLPDIPAAIPGLACSSRNTAAG